jgi:hypothetical protein
MDNGQWVMGYGFWVDMLRELKHLHEHGHAMNINVNIEHICKKYVNIYST